MEKVLGKSGYSKVTNALIFILPVISGGLIYILLRPAEPVFLNWIRVAGLDNLFQILRNNSLLTSGYFPEWLIYSSPSGLWAFSYSFIISRIWKGNKSLLKYFWLGSIPVLVFGFEVSQLTRKMPGTFCFEDILFGALGIVFGFAAAIKLNFLNR